MRRLSSPSLDKQTFACIHRTKQTITDAIQSLETVAVGSKYGVCSILHCTEQGTMSLNSLAYCDFHIGLSLLNGMRHASDSKYNSDACTLFNIMALKQTVHPNDSGHVHHHIETLELPWKDVASEARDGPRLRVQRFYDPDGLAAMRVIDRPARWIKRHEKVSYRRSADGPLLLVRCGSLAHINHLNRAVAWLRVKMFDIRSEKWVLVDTNHRLQQLAPQLPRGYVFADAFSERIDLCDWTSDDSWFATHL